MPTNDALDTWSLDREIVLSGVFAAAREEVYQAWTDPGQLASWFCPEGFTTETIAIDVRPGGVWRFVYVAPDAGRYDNRVTYLRLEAPSLLVFDHGPDEDDDPHRFRVTITIDAQSDGKSVLTLRQLHPTKEQRDGTIGFGAVEIGYTTLDKLAAHLATRAAR